MQTRRAKHPLAKVDTINHSFSPVQPKKQRATKKLSSSQHESTNDGDVPMSNAGEDDQDGSDEQEEEEQEEEEISDEEDETQQHSHSHSDLDHTHLMLEDEDGEPEEDSDDEEQIEVDEEEEEEVSDEEDGGNDDDASSDEGSDRSDDEVEQIKREMQELEDSVPGLRGSYNLVDRLGEGTFSSVYKALDVHHSLYTNDLWALPLALTPTDSTTGQRDPLLADEDEIPPLKALREQQRKGRVFVAIKRIYVTSSPERILNELEILRDLRGSTNIAYLIEAIRHEDQVIAIMPYSRHQDFREYYRHATLPLLRSYLASLFRALHSTHTKFILHRDVKPANFLYDIHTGVGVLCDFGLAEKINGLEWASECLHGFPHRNKLHGDKLVKPIHLFDQFKSQNLAWMERKKKWEENGRSRSEKSELRSSAPHLRGEWWENELRTRRDDSKEWFRNWGRDTRDAERGTGRMVGFLRDDIRPSVRANRAGTRGFRAPEVLFKCPDQTAALDIWSVGIILLCFLTRRFPFFNSNDDTEALAEITAIFGRKAIQKCAGIHNRNFLTNIPTFDVPPHISFHALVKSLNPSILVENSPTPHGPIPSSEEDDATWYPNSEISLAIDLMKRCLELDLTKRWTAEECLEHRFFDGEFDLGGGRRGPRGVMHSAVSEWEK